MKKILRLILILALIAGFGWFLFWLLNPGGGTTQDQFIGRVRDFFPFGSSDSGLAPDGEPTPFDPEEYDSLVNERSATATLPDLEQIYARPIAGYTILGTSTPILRIVDRATGHITDINTTTKRETRISNTTLPGIREALWFSNGTGVIMRYLKQNSDIVETLVVTGLREGSETTSGIYLEENISAILPISNTELAYIIPQGFGSVIKTYNTNTQNVSTVTQSTIQSWNILGGNNRLLFLQTKASVVSPGYIYALVRSTGELQKIEGGMFGLNALLAPDNQSLFITTGGENAYSYNLNLNTRAITFTEMKTEASKCTFESTYIYCGVPVSFANTMPDSWYMGIIELADQIWSINLESGEYRFVRGLPTLDTINLQLHTDNKHLFFINKRDGSVWIHRFNTGPVSE